MWTARELHVFYSLRNWLRQAGYEETLTIGAVAGVPHAKFGNDGAQQCQLMRAQRTYILAQVGGGLILRTHNLERGLRTLVHVLGHKGSVEDLPLPA